MEGVSGGRKLSSVDVYSTPSLPGYLCALDSAPPAVLPPHGLPSPSLWTGLRAAEPHPFAEGGALSGEFPVRDPRGSSELRLNRPSLWGHAAEALGFRVTSLRLFGSARSASFSSYLSSSFPDARSGEEVHIVCGNVSALPGWDSAYLEQSIGATPVIGG